VQALLLCRSGYFRNLLRPDGGFNDADNATITLDGCPFDADVRGTAIESWPRSQAARSWPP